MNNRKLRLPAAYRRPALLVATAMAGIQLPTCAFAHDEASSPATWRGRVEFYGSRDPDRPIDAGVVLAERVIPLPAGFDIAFGAGALSARGDRVDPGEAPRNSDATGFVAGGTLRFAPVEIGRVRPFAEGSLRVLYTFGDPFPAGGSSINGFVGWGGGVSVAVTPKLAIEGGYRRVHVSNGGGLVPYNPAWNGEGGFLGVAWQF